MSTKYLLVKSVSGQLTAKIYSNDAEAAAEMYKQFSSSPKVTELILNGGASINTQNGSAFVDPPEADSEGSDTIDWKIFSSSDKNYLLVKLQNGELTASGYDIISEAAAEMYKQFSAIPKAANLIFEQKAEIDTNQGTAFVELPPKDDDTNDSASWKIFSTK